jgi:hydrogenase/urease accessory protein HupE
MRAAAAAFLALCLGLQTGAASGHALQPGYLQLEALGSDSWRVFWKKPAVGGYPMPIEARLPESCDLPGPPEPRFEGGAYVASWVASCPDGLAGGEIAVLGLKRTETDVLVRYEIEPGDAQTRRLTPGEPAFTVPAAAGRLDVAQTYFGLGVDHILQGADHLLFVFALLLLVRDRWKLVGAITAFTVAHSLTLAAATLGWIILPAPPVEAVVALSIMFLASELVQREGAGTRLSERYPWLIAFAFGLLHGLGFARALLDVGLPQDDVPLALLMFNLGVEAGQLLFIGFVLLVGSQLRRLYPATLTALERPGGAGVVSTSYAIGTLAAFWFVSRVAAF